MAKMKEAARPSKVSKPQKAAKATKAAAQKANHRSQEYVVDSDDEDAAPEDRGVKKVNSGITSTKAQPIPKAPEKKGLQPQEAEESESEDSEVEEDEEDQEDDDGEDESDEDEDEEGGKKGDERGAEIEPPKSLKKPDKVPAKVNGVKRGAEQAGSSDEDSEEEADEDELPSPPVAKKSKVAAPAAPAARSNEEGKSEGGSGTGKSTLQDQEAVTSIPAQPYKAPAGYTAMDLTNAQSSIGLLQGSSNGKQIWHITAPSDVSLSSISEVALNAIQSGKTTLSHQGTDWVMNEDETTRDHESVFVPAANGYTPAPQKISKTLHLQQKISLPDLSSRQASQLTGSGAAGDVAQAPVNTVRPQPKGLRMRYKPAGFGSGKPGMIDSGGESAEDEGQKGKGQSFQFPKTLGAHGMSEGQDTVETGNNADVASSAKKSKKKRKEKPQDPIEDGMVDSRPAVTQPSADRSHQEGTIASITAIPIKNVVVPEAVSPADVTMTNGDSSHVLSKEEKAKRKEEKRLKREKKEAKARTKQP